MRTTLVAALTALLLCPGATAFAGHGSGGGGSQSGGSHSGGFHGGHSHGGGSHGGGFHGGRSHGGGGRWGGWHGGSHGHGWFWHPRRGWVCLGAPFWGGWGWGPWWPDGYSYGYYREDDDAGYDDEEDDWAVVDLKVSPPEARVYLEGRLIGTADEFDGDPDFLYLQPGTYRLELRLRGYESISQDIDAQPGRRIEAGKRLHRVPGASSKGPVDTSPPEGRARRFWGKQGGAVRSFDEEMRPRQDNRRSGDVGGYDDPEDAPPSPADRTRDDASSQGATDDSDPGSARLSLSINPPDAVLYLDDRLLGTAEEIGRGGGVTVAPGEHKITALRPGFQEKSAGIDVSPGDETTVKLSLRKRNSLP